jgi:hypothetical protein
MVYITWIFQALPETLHTAGTRLLMEPLLNAEVLNLNCALQKNAVSKHP